MEDHKNIASSTKKEDIKEEKNKKMVPNKNEEFKPNFQNKKAKKLPSDTNTKKNEINIVMDIFQKRRYFLSENFERGYSDYNEENEDEKEEENDDENKQYTKNNVEIYIDNIKSKFTRFISEKEFPEEKVYQIKLKFKILFTNCDQMFEDCTGITSIDLSNFDMSKVKSMIAMFRKCTNLISVKFPNSNTVNLTNMNFMFVLCENLTNVNITSLNTKNVEHMNALFLQCTKLKNLDLSHFNIKRQRFNFLWLLS